MCILYVKLFCVILCCMMSVFLFRSLCIYLYVMYLYDLFHVLLSPLQTEGSIPWYVCMYVRTYLCMCMYVYHYIITDTIKE
jgi:hypothetical protein